MRLSSTKEAQVYGDIKQNEVTIDAENLNKVVMILSSNLYSEPIPSFIREITSNAWDSHVEAGNLNEPVIISIDGNEDKIVIGIRDYGTGLSPERFDAVYRKMGASTKTDSDEYHGMFGIGKFSMLAPTEVATVTSFYEGIKYTYLMYKNGLGINIDLLDTQETTEANGVNVEVELSRSDYYTVIYAIEDQLTFFENVYINDTVNSNNYFNNIKVKHFESFSVSTVTNKVEVLLGRVLYPFEKNKLVGLTPEEWELVNTMNTSLALRFNIGELDVNPTRETLMYSERTIKAIVNKLREVKSELFSIKRVQLNNGVIKIDTLKKLPHPSTVFDDLVKKITIPPYNEKVQIEGNEIEYTELWKDVDNISETPLVKPTIHLDGEVFYKAGISNLTVRDVLIGNLVNYSPKDYKTIEKKYIRQTFGSTYLRDDWGEVLKGSFLKRTLLNSSVKNKFLVKLMYKLLYERLSTIKTFDLSGLNEEFIKLNTTKPKKNTNKGEYMFTIYTHSYKGSYHIVTEDYFTNSKDTFIGVYKSDADNVPPDELPNIKFVTAYKPVVDRLIKKGVFKSFNDFVNENEERIKEDRSKCILEDEFNNYTSNRVLNLLEDKGIKVVIPELHEAKFKERPYHFFYRYLPYEKKESITPEVSEEGLLFRKIIKISEAYYINSDLGGKFFIEKLELDGIIKDKTLNLTNINNQSKKKK